MSMMPARMVRDPDDKEVLVAVSGVEARDGVIPKFVTAYGPKLAFRVDVSKGGPGAKQSFKDECDINRIMAKYQKTGVVTWLNRHEARWGDATGIEFQESMNVIVKANEMFADLPSSVRKRFHNDPVEFLDFMHNKENEDEIYKLGLAKRPVVPPKAEPIEVRVIPEPPPVK